ncbi:Glutathione peroxidase [Synechococcus elongatus PCC 7942 = FACHB-805]|uniref:Glutathione peroxidase n=3 Tax=Synechococcus elongatus TaxID=32046 RepID=Q79PF2_SYNE7|nr:glutathione peroxidase [Synechococcus elongatus PCC 7942 = FACHB-805]ABB57244.1 Glutathione peroxidase [Synechococcus elongatus PCC 7942 = FACHB-805]BAA37105.1 vitami B12 transporter protein/glutathione peroxidase [Synechococcus elongatus PCC 7942 = FACHB-805]BAD78526.1 glutathione peroxidase [Synechococcus elongatus PCC 6301]
MKIRNVSMAPQVTDIAVTTIDGAAKSLSDYAGQVLLIVNVASYCGYTSQYSGLEALYRQYRDRGLQVLAFPCNDFGAQEPGSNEEIKTFCSTRFDVSFELFDKVHAKGADQHPLYAALTQTDPAGDVAWNFEKFLVGKDGTVLARFKSGVAPNDASLIQAIEAALAA